MLEVLILLELSAKYLSCTATLNNEDNPMVCLDPGKAQRHATSLASRCFVAQLKVWTISVIFSLIPLLMLMHGVLLVLFVCLTSSSSSMNSLARNMWQIYDMLSRMSMVEPEGDAVRPVARGSCIGGLDERDHISILRRWLVAFANSVKQEQT
jgi:hypothetical protein